MKNTHHNFKIFSANASNREEANSTTSFLDLCKTKERFCGVSWGAEKPHLQMKGKASVPLLDVDISRALEYLFVLATKEVKKFNKEEMVNRIAVENQGILFSKSRLLDCHRFTVAAGLETTGLGDANLNMITPLIDRHSPLAYAVGDYIHRVLCSHRGYEACYRMSLTFCHIIQGANLFKEIGNDCVKCKMFRKKYLDVAMGPVSDFQITIAPPFYVCMADMFGPLTVYVPGHERVTRNRRILTSKVWVLVFACPVSKLLNLQVIETKSADGVLDGLTRLGCEVGFPNHFLVDQDTSFLKFLHEAEVDLLNLQFEVKRQFNVEFSTCPVTGHNYHGLVE